MTGEMHQSEVTREAFPHHFAIAEALGGSVHAFDQYQGPFVQTPHGKLWLSTDDGALGYVYNDDTGCKSEPFDLYSEHGTHAAVWAAMEASELRQVCTSSGLITLHMAMEDARNASHQGQCDEDVRALSEDKTMAYQLAAIDPELLRRELKEYGAWDATELADHDQNLQRILWLLAGDIVEEANNEGDNDE